MQFFHYNLKTIRFFHIFFKVVNAIIMISHYLLFNFLLNGEKKTVLFLVKELFFSFTG